MFTFTIGDVKQARFVAKALPRGVRRGSDPVSNSHA